jgi:hypothetical protein
MRGHACLRPPDGAPQILSVRVRWMSYSFGVSGAVYFMLMQRAEAPVWEGES